MTREEAAKNAEVMLAWSRGEVVQYRRKFEGEELYRDCEDARFDFLHNFYRVKPAPPAPKYRPWTPEEAIGKAVRSRKSVNGWNSKTLYIVISANEDVATFSADRWVSFNCLRDCFVTADGLPCGVEVTE